MKILPYALASILSFMVVLALTLSYAIYLSYGHEGFSLIPQLFK